MREVTVLQSAKFYVTLTGRMNFHGFRPIGPAIAEVRIVQATEANKAFTPSYYVSVNGEHCYGGFACHLRGGLASALGGSFTNVTPVFRFSD